MRAGILQSMPSGSIDSCAAVSDICMAHRSKRLEFEQVWLADDYLRFFKDGVEVPAEEVEPQEVNILYVALTRAQAAIRLCESFEEWLRARRLMPAERA